MRSVGQLIKKILLWIVTGFFALAALVHMTSGSILPGLLAVAFVVLVIPIDRWQAKIGKVIKGKRKPILAVVLAVLVFATVPPAEPVDNGDVTPPAVTDVVGTFTEPTTKPISAPTTEPTDPITEPTTSPTTVPTTKPTVPVTGPTEPVTEPPMETTEEEGQDYVVNTNTKKFHVPGCSSVKKIKGENRWDYHGTREDLIDMDYKPCGICHP